MIGYQFFQKNNFYWRRHHGALIPLSMPHIPTSISTLTALKLLVSKRAFFIRWDENFDQVKSSEWWHVIKDSSEELNNCSVNTRSKIRRADKKFFAAPASVAEILGNGYKVYCSAFDRYKTFESVFSEEDFQNAVSCLPKNTEFWSVRLRSNNEMVAFSENLVKDDACFYNTIWLKPDSLSSYSGYLLIHEMSKHYLNERRLKYVTDGSRSISHQTNIHDFLIQKFGFRRAYSCIRIIYFPGLGIIVRILYPFRKLMSKSKSCLVQKILVLLEQERIRRSCLSNCPKT